MGSRSASDFAVMDFSSQQRFVDGQILLIDKPLEWTSFDVVNKLRWALRNHLGVKKFKVGHAGTCLLYTSPSPRDRQKSRMPSSA